MGQNPTGPCELCGLVGEHRHGRHVLEIHGDVDGMSARLRLDGCLACQRPTRQMTAAEPCPALLEVRL